MWWILTSRRGLAFAARVFGRLLQVEGEKVVQGRSGMGCNGFEIKSCSIVGCNGEKAAEIKPNNLINIQEVTSLSWKEFALQKLSREI